MLRSPTLISNWPLAKQYLAAHFFLSEEKPINMSEAQRTLLGALHLFVNHGPYSPGTDLTHFDKCTLAEKRKRIEEWKRLGVISRTVAMQKFISLVSELFPNWTRYKKLLTQFNSQWGSIKPKTSQSRPRQTLKRYMMPNPRHELSSSPRAQRDIESTSIEKVHEFQLSRFKKRRDILPELNAKHDALETYYVTNLYTHSSPVRKYSEESTHYRIPVSRRGKVERVNFRTTSLIDELTDWRMSLVSRDHTERSNIRSSPMHKTLFEGLLEVQERLNNIVEN